MGTAVIELCSWSWPFSLRDLVCKTSHYLFIYCFLFFFHWCLMLWLHTNKASFHLLTPYCIIQAEFGGVSGAWQMLLRNVGGFRRLSPAASVLCVCSWETQKRCHYPLYTCLVGLLCTPVVCTKAAHILFHLMKTVGLFLLMWSISVCASSGEWAQTGNLVYRVIDFPTAQEVAGYWFSGTVMSLQTVWGVYLSMIRYESLSPLNTGQIFLSLCPPAFITLLSSPPPLTLHSSWMHPLTPMPIVT